MLTSRDERRRRIVMISGMFHNGKVNAATIPNISTIDRFLIWHTHTKDCAMANNPRKNTRGFFDPRFIQIERRRSHRLALILFWSVLTALFVYHFIVTTGIVTDRSMLPTLRSGDTFLVNKYIYLLTRPQRDDIVVLKPSPQSNDRYVKRVIAVEGETLHIHNGRVSINGKQLSEPYAAGYTSPDFGPYLLPAGTYFVMGDNRLNSLDSRHFGPVRRSRIEGKIKPGELFSWH